MNHPLSSRFAGPLFCAFLFAMVGCPTPPPKTQRARTAAEFQQLLSSVVPAGTTKKDALWILPNREGLNAKEIISGDFTENPGEPTEKVHKDIHYLHCQRTVMLKDGRQKQINTAFVLENDSVKELLVNEEIVEPDEDVQETD